MKIILKKNDSQNKFYEYSSKENSTEIISQNNFNENNFQNRKILSHIEPHSNRITSNFKHNSFDSKELLFIELKLLIDTELNQNVFKKLNHLSANQKKEFFKPRYWKITSVKIYILYNFVKLQLFTTKYNSFRRIMERTPFYLLRKMKKFENSSLPQLQSESINSNLVDNCKTENDAKYKIVNEDEKYLQNIILQ